MPATHWGYAFAVVIFAFSFIVLSAVLFIVLFVVSFIVFFVVSFIVLFAVSSIFLFAVPLTVFHHQQPKMYISLRSAASLRKLVWGGLIKEALIRIRRPY